MDIKSIIISRLENWKKNKFAFVYDVILITFLIINIIGTFFPIFRGIALLMSVLITACFIFASIGLLIAIYDELNNRRRDIDIETFRKMYQTPTKMVNLFITPLVLLLTMHWIASIFAFLTIGIGYIYHLLVVSNSKKEENNTSEENIEELTEEVVD